MGNQHSTTNTNTNIIDLNRYSGDWIELAKYPFFPEKRCQYVTTNYTIDGEDLIVNNYCWVRKSDLSPIDQQIYAHKPQKGEYILLSNITGKARPVEGSGNVLKVKFGALPPGRYEVIWTDYENFSIVKGNDRHLWILGRRDNLTELDYILLNKIIDKYNINRDKLLWNITPA